jgi:hypothetical protein
VVLLGALRAICPAAIVAAEKLALRELPPADRELGHDHLTRSENLSILKYL